MKVLVLAGGFDQIGLIKEIKSYGHEVILADYFENPPAKRYADKHFQVSTLDEEAIYMLAKEQEVDKITTACTDQALLTVAKVSERLGLPTYISYTTALNVTHKKYMKEVFLENGIPTAKCHVLKDASELSSILSNIIYPVVVKPCDCNSSKGVIKVDCEDELKVAISNAFSLSRSKNVIVESFIEGQEISIDVWVDDEDAKILSVSQTEKVSDSQDSFTIYKSKYPVHMTDVVKKQMEDVVRKIALSFDLKNCPILVQAIIDEKSIYVIEFSARMGGGTKYRLIEYMSGVNIMKTYVKRELGDVNQIINCTESEKIIELNYVYAHNGTFVELKNFEECKQSGEIEEYYQYKESGALIEKAKTSSDRVAGFLLIADSVEEMEKKRHEVIQKLDVIDGEGNSMMIKSIYLN